MSQPVKSTETRRQQYRNSSFISATLLVFQRETSARTRFLQPQNIAVISSTLPVSHEERSMEEKLHPLKSQGIFRTLLVSQPETSRDTRLFSEIKPECHSVSFMQNVPCSNRKYQWIRGSYSHKTCGTCCGHTPCSSGRYQGTKDLCNI